VYLALALRDVFHGLASNPDSGVAGVAQRGKELLGGALHAYTLDATGLGVGVGVGASAAADSGAGGIADPDVEALALAARADMGKTEDVPCPAVRPRPALSRRLAWLEPWELSRPRRDGATAHCAPCARV